MIISHISKPWQTVPSVAYGAIEKMLAELISFQTNDKVLLFAPGGSMVGKNVELFSLYDEGQGDKGLDRNTELTQSVHGVINSIENGVDILHVHSVDSFLGISPFITIPSVFSFYCNASPATEILSKMATNFTNFTFLSNSHKKNFPWIKNSDVIYFGLDLKNFPFSQVKKDYLLFVGSIADKKGIMEAIEISKKSGIRLKIGAKVKNEDKCFYEKVFLPVIRTSENVQYLGEVTTKERNLLMKNAKALLFPIKWAEPLGMVMLESLAVGTPVIAFNCGSVPEVIEDGHNGYIVENIQQAVKAVKRLDRILPINCQNTIREKFNIKNTAFEFDRLYKRVLARK